MSGKISHVIAGVAGAIVALLIAFASGRIQEPDTSSLAEIMAADAAFAVVGDEQGFGPAFDAYAADDILMFMSGDPVRGRTELVAALSGRAPGATVWSPLGGEISAGGDLGYTWGSYVSVPTEEGAEPGAGHYVTIWRKDSDGQWKVIADIGN